MQIVVDEQIPCIDELFTGHSVHKKPGEAIQRQDLLNADMLWVRTVTTVDETLLSETPVRFVGTATAGYDHLDTEWLDRHHIAWACAPGANAVAVAEYVLCVIAALRTLDQLKNQPLRAGVIGVGKVGTVVVDYLTQLGFQVIVNDPPRALREPDFHSFPLSEFTDLDLLCVHPALVQTGAFSSYHLLDDVFFQRQKPGMVLINASRGPVIATEVLLRQRHLCLCLDVWEHEPFINTELLQRVVIGTPHIAGYSIDAKRRASWILYQQAQKFFNLNPINFQLNKAAENQWWGNDWEERALKIFNPLEYTKEMVSSEKQFLELRKYYPWRNSLSP